MILVYILMGAFFGYILIQLFRPKKKATPTKKKGGSVTIYPQQPGEELPTKPRKPEVEEIV